MIRKIKKYIEDQHLLPENLYCSDVKIIVGLSGGADSVALLSVLNQIGYTCIAVHCNFHLRGDESDRDEKASREIANNLNIPFFKKDFDTIGYAKEKGISIEMSARNLRYEWFEQKRKEEEADFIAVAHHSNDNIETFFLNLIRGTGIKGLTGIPPKNDKIIRPLLSVSRNDIIEYLKLKDIPYVTDSTNLQEEFTRNKIRLSFLPLFESINPSINSSILRTMENLTEVHKIYDAEIQKSKKDVFDPGKNTINIKKLKNTISPESVLFEILKEFKFDRDTIKNIYQAIDSQSGKEFYSSDFHLIKDRDQFMLYPHKTNVHSTYFEIEKKEQIIHSPLSFELFFKPVNNSFHISKNKNTAYFDENKLQFPLILRKWKDGDKFIPFGMNGSQKLSDFFNNNKISRPEKENIWLLCSGNEIIWIIGYRTDDRYKITKESQNACVIKLF